MHKIETIIVFISLHDEIFIEKINSKKHKVSFTGKFSRNIGKNNTVSKLLDILDKKKLLNNKKFKVKIKKKIPSKAGLGGGSMNASNILNYFIKKRIVKISQKEVIKISKLVGSDVILGLNPTNSVLTTNNEVKRFNNCKKFYSLIVKPNFGCSTKEIYSKVKKFNKPKFNNPNSRMFNLDYLKKMETFLFGV